MFNALKMQRRVYKKNNFYILEIELPNLPAPSINRRKSSHLTSSPALPRNPLIGLAHRSKEVPRIRSSKLGPLNASLNSAVISSSRGLSISPTGCGRQGGALFVCCGVEDMRFWICEGMVGGRKLVGVRGSVGVYVGR
jgi:hypothetical protein